MFELFSSFPDIPGLDRATELIGLGAGLLTGVALFNKSVRSLTFGKWMDEKLHGQVKFDSIWDDGITMQDEDGGLHRVIELRGMDFAAISNEDRVIKCRTRKVWTESLGRLNVRVKIISRNQRGNHSVTTRPPAPILKEIDRVWQGQFETAIDTTHYVILSVANEKHVTRLQDAEDKTMQYLEGYKPRILGEVSKYYSPLLTFWASLLNPLVSTKVGSFRENLKEHLLKTNVNFMPSGVMEFFQGPNKMYAATVGFESWGDHTDDEMLAAILNVDAEITVLNLVKTLDESKSNDTIVMKRQLAWECRVIPEIKDQYDEAVKLTTRGTEKNALVSMHNISVIVYGETLDGLKQSIKDVAKALEAFGVISKVEESLGAAAWFSLFPGREHFSNDDLFFSDNVASVLGLEGNNAGWERSSWGPGSIQKFKPVSGSGSVNFQFHEGPGYRGRREVGHTILTGRTGGGKTTLISMLMAGAMRHPDLRIVALDRRRGMYVFTKAAGGAYMSFDKSDDNSCQLNPLQLELTTSNRNFLKRWFKLISKLSGPKIDRQIDMILRTLEKMPVIERSLKAIWATHLNDTDLGEAIYGYVHDPDLAWLYNGKEDALSKTIKENRLVTFDTKGLLENNEIAPGFLAYLLHVQEDVNVRDNVPFMAVIDEAARAFRSEEFREMALEMIYEWRKLNGVAVFNFQTDETIVELGLEKILKDQTATQIFFRSNKLDSASLSNWGLIDREIDFLLEKTAPNVPFSVLVKQKDLSLPILTDLGPLNKPGRFLSEAFNSNAEAAIALDVLIAEHGETEGFNRYFACEGNYDDFQHAA